MPDPVVVFGRVPKPPIVDRTIPNYQTFAWNNLGQRYPVGACQHSMVGSLIGTDKWFRNGIPSSNHIAQGLTDYGVGGATDGPALDGVIYQWNDPWGFRTPWANGGSDGLEGDGPLYVRTYGINAINQRLPSIERSDGGNINTPMSPKQFESICALTAWIFDKCKVPWYTFPINPASGAVTHMLHFEFATKACPFDPVRSNINAIQNRVRSIMKQYQQVATQPLPEPELPPEKPVEPDHSVFPNGWTPEALKKRFGEVPSIDFTVPNPVVEPRTWNARGMISNAWVQRAHEEGIKEISKIPLPGAITISQSRDGVKSSTFVVPRSGRKDWVAFKGDGNSAWIWIQ